MYTFITLDFEQDFSRLDIIRSALQIAEITNYVIEYDNGSCYLRVEENIGTLFPLRNNYYFAGELSAIVNKI